MKEVPDLQEESGAGLTSKAVGGSQDAAGVLGLQGGDGASSGQHEGRPFQGGRWKKPRDGARRGRSGGAGTPPELGRDFRYQREVAGPPLAVEALRRPYPLPPRVPSYSLHPVSEGALTLLRPTSRGPRPSSRQPSTTLRLTRPYFAGTSFYF